MPKRDVEDFISHWQGGPAAARRTRGLTIVGAHGATRPAQIICQLDNPKLIE